MTAVILGIVSAGGAGAAHPGPSTGAAMTRADTSPHPDVPRTVAHVDIQRYMGTWYEIANYPNMFQRGCTGTTATYALRPDGQVSVTNRCRKDSLSGPESVARARARVVDSSTNAKLEVQFFWPFWGKYWVIDLDAEYRWAVVGHPARKYLWVLSRTPEMDPKLYAAIVQRIAAQGYDTTRIVRTVQPRAAAGP